MPNNEEHCEHSFKRYGVRGEDIHKFLDEPCRTMGQNHREYRHDTKTIRLVGEVFGKKYGRELAESIALDHITADHEEEIRNRKENVLLLKCPNCGGNLEGQGGKKICGYCGFETEVLGRFHESERISSIKLPAKNRWLLLYRDKNDDTLPLVLPPLYINGYYQLGGSEKVIDDVYSSFEDKARVELLLEHGLGYSPVTVGDLRLDKFGNLTDRQIKELALKSKSVTSEQIKELLNKPEVKEFESRYEIEFRAERETSAKKKGLKVLIPAIVFALGGFWMANPSVYGWDVTIVWVFIGFFVGSFSSLFWMSLNRMNPVNRIHSNMHLIEKVKTSRHSAKKQGQAKPTLSDAELRKKIRSFLLVSNVVFIPLIVLSLAWVIGENPAYSNPYFIIGMLLFAPVLTAALSLVGWYGRHTKEHNPP